MENSTLVTSLMKAKSVLAKQKEEMDRKSEQLAQNIEAYERVILIHKENIRSEAIGKSKKTASNQVKEPSIPKQNVFSNSDTWKGKISFIVGELAPCDYIQVSNRLRELQPELDEEKARKAVQYYLSRLYIEGKIKANKSGTLSKYSL